MHWGEAQSMFQIMLALNLAYFSFKQIRAPALERRELEADKQRAALDAVNAKLTNIPGIFFRDRGLDDGNIHRDT
jgi:hypothetical protein